MQKPTKSDNLALTQHTGLCQAPEAVAPILSAALQSAEHVRFARAEHAEQKDYAFRAPAEISVTYNNK